MAQQAGLSLGHKIQSLQNLLTKPKCHRLTLKPSPGHGVQLGGVEDRREESGARSLAQSLRVSGKPGHFLTEIGLDVHAGLDPQLHGSAGPHVGRMRPVNLCGCPQCLLLYQEMQESRAEAEERIKRG